MTRARPKSNDAAQSLAQQRGAIQLRAWHASMRCAPLGPL